MNTRGIDPSSDEDFAGWFEVMQASHAHGWPHRPGWQPEELRAKALNREIGNRRELIVAMDEEGTIVGSASVKLPERDNRHMAELVVEVHPSHRRNGAGSALLESAEQLARNEDRRLLIAEQRAPVSSEAASAGRRFALHHGYSCAHTEVLMELETPADAKLLQRLQSECEPHSSGYRLTLWQDHCPEALVADRAVLAAKMSTDSPHGELEWLEESWDASRVREMEQLVSEMNRTLLSAGAIEESSGRLVAFTEIALARAAPRAAYQWDTLVLDEHRGHRLGMLVKIANLRSLAERSPGTHFVITGNAATNRPMIAINEALGFEVVGHRYAWHKRLSVGQSPQVSGGPSRAQ